MSQDFKEKINHIGEYSPSVHTSRGMLEQMAVYMSVKLLNNEDGEDKGRYTKTGK